MLITTTQQRLVGVSQTAHAAHHAQHVVVQGIHADLRRARTDHRVDGHSKLESRLVNAAEVARAAGLVLLGAQRKRVHVDTRRRRAAVVLEGLHLVEVGTLTLRETVLAVQLELGDLNRVLALATNARVQNHLGEQVVHTGLKLLGARKILSVSANERRRLRRTLSEEGSGGGHVRSTDVGSLGGAELGSREQRHDQTLRAEVVGVVEGLRTADRRNPVLVRAVHERVALHHPEELLDGVVEVQLDLVGRARDGLGASVLHLLNQVLVALLSEAAALLGVEVDVVNIQGGGGQGLSRGGGSSDSRLAETLLVVHGVLPRLKVHIDADLVVLQRNQRDRETRVAAEPELQRNVKRLGRCSPARHA